MPFLENACVTAAGKARTVGSALSAKADTGNTRQTLISTGLNTGGMRQVLPEDTLKILKFNCEISG